MNGLREFVYNFWDFISAVSTILGVVSFIIGNKSSTKDHISGNGDGDHTVGKGSNKEKNTGKQVLYEDIENNDTTGNQEIGDSNRNKTTPKKRASILALIVFLVLAIFSWHYHEVHVYVPPVIGLSTEIAKKTLGDNGLEMELEEGQNYDAHKVIKTQNPKAKELVKIGDTVICGYGNTDIGIEKDTVNDSDTSNNDIVASNDGTIGNSDESNNESSDHVTYQRVEKVPDVVNMEQSDAIHLLYLSGFGHIVSMPVSKRPSKGDKLYVVSQEPAAGSVEIIGSKVSTMLSSEEPDIVKQYPTEKKHDGSIPEGYFIIYNDDSTVPSKLDIITGEQSFPGPEELIDEELVYVELDFYGIDVSEAWIWISVEGMPGGVGLSDSLWITPGNYIITANIGDKEKKTELTIKDGGNYPVYFE